MFFKDIYSIYNVLSADGLDWDNANNRVEGNAAAWDDYVQVLLILILFCIYIYIGNDVCLN